MKEKFQTVGRSLKKAGQATGNACVIGAKATANGCVHAKDWCGQKVKDYKDYRAMLEELDDVAGNLAQEISKFNSLMEVRQQISALERQKILMEKVAKEMKQCSN